MLDINTYSLSGPFIPHVMIRRSSDRFLLDCKDLSFKAGKDTLDFEVKLHVLESEIFEYGVKIDSSLWEDGEYIIYYYNVACYALDTVHLRSGIVTSLDANTLTALTSRLFDCNVGSHTAPDSMGEWMHESRKFFKNL